MDQQINEISDPPPGVEPNYGFAAYAIAEVKDAVQSAWITRSHGALLAALRDDVQATAVRNLLAISLLPGVGELKLSIQSMATSLDNACFDKDDCANCRYNSTNHSEMFETFLDAGYCVNSDCAAAKTKVTVDLKAKSLAPKYRVVKIMPVKFQPVESGGEFGVGETQAKSCHEECESFGAVVGASATGNLLAVESVCTDSDCHGRMVAAHLRAQVNAYKSKLWRYALEKHMQAAPIQQKRALLVALQALGWASGDKLKSTLQLDGDMSVSGLVSACLGMNQEQLVAAINQLPAAMIANAPLHQVGEVLRSLNVRLQDYWRMKADFLERLSAEELLEVAQDLGVVFTTPVKEAQADGERLLLAKAIGGALEARKLEGYVPRCLQT